VFFSSLVLNTLCVVATLANLGANAIVCEMHKKSRGVSLILATSTIVFRAEILL
jgi:hypothetical protein